MTDLMVAVKLTKNVGAPALGETLTDIDLWLTRADRVTGATTAIWTGVEHPDTEQVNVGVYTLVYSGADLDKYNYFATAHYTGLTVLDQDWIGGGVGVETVPLGTAIEWPYQVQTAGAVPIEGVNVWFYDENSTYIVWAGVTDSNGYARDVFNFHPRLDPGTYKVYRQRAGYSFSDPDTEVVS